MSSPKTRFDILAMSYESLKESEKAAAALREVDTEQ